MYENLQQIMSEHEHELTEEVTDPEALGEGSKWWGMNE